MLGGHPLAQGLVGAWLLNDGAGATANDAARGDTGTLVNSPLWQPDGGDTGLRLVSASDQYVNVHNPAQLQITGDITVVCHYKLASVPAQPASYQLVANDSNTAGRAFTMDVYNSSATTYGLGVRFYLNGGATGDSVFEVRQPVAGDSRVVAGTWSKATQALRLYVNGVQAGAITSASTSINATTGNVLLGRREYAGYTEPLDGWLRYVYIYNRTLSAAEVASLYRDPYQMIAPPAPWRFYSIPATVGGRVHGVFGSGVIGSGIVHGLSRRVE